MAYLIKRHWLEHSLSLAPVDDSIIHIEAAQEHRRPDLGKLHELVVFTKDLILTYHAVLLVVFVLFSLYHWHQKFQVAWRSHEKAREARYDSLAYARHPTQIESSLAKDASTLREVERDGSSSSSSSTLEGNATPPTKDDASDSRLPLLENGKSKIPRAGLWNYLRALMMYQPPPMPFVNKVLPSNATSLFVLCFTGVNAFYLCYNCPMSLNMIFVFADRAGMLFVANLPLLYLLGAKNQPIKFMTGYSYESLNILHRRLGEILCLLAFLHTAGMFGVWYTILRPAHLNLAWFLTQKIVLIGLFAFAAYELLYFTSLGSFRQRWYELFLVSHVGLQVAALILLWFHHHTTRAYVGIALAIFILDRAIFRFILKFRATEASLTVLEDGKTVKVSAAWQIPPRRGLQTLVGLTQNYKFGWKPTEHVFLTIPALLHKHPIEAHPFTIASAAPTDPHGQAKLDLVIRAQDGFSKDLVAYAKHTPSTTVRMDGPYGSQHAVDLLETSDVAVVVAGGSGIAVAYPLVSALLTHPSDPEHGRRATAMRKICLVWVTHERSHHSWLGDAKLQGLRDAGVDVVLPPPTAEAGRPDVARMVRACIAENVDAGVRQKVGVVCSGPDGMNRTVRNACAGMVWKGWDVGVEVEKFGW